MPDEIGYLRHGRRTVNRRLMNMRVARTVFVAFLVANVLAVIVHGLILANDYGPFYGKLLRSTGDPDWQVVLLPVPHLLYVCGLTWVTMRLQSTSSRLHRGLVLGALGWVIGQAPLWLLWYIEQPWPDSLVVKQLGLEFLSSLLIGLTIVFAWGRDAARPLVPTLPELIHGAQLARERVCSKDQGVGPASGSSDNESRWVKQSRSA